MAKNQSFGNKIGKQKSSSNHHIKLIRAGRASKTGALRFYEEVVHVPDGKNAEIVAKDFFSRKS